MPLPLPLRTARQTDLSGRPTGVIYRQQYVRCGKSGCRSCPPLGHGHGPYWYAFYWDYRQRTQNFYVGKNLPRGVELIPNPSLREADPPAGEQQARQPDDATSTNA